MAKIGPKFQCTNCNALHAKWSGRCDGCGEWNTVKEVGSNTGLANASSGGKLIELAGLKYGSGPPERSPLGIGEFDRVLGGGLVPAGTILVGGDPGIGKSTLLLQAAAAFAADGGTAVYISGEESRSQIGLRADRLGLSDAPVLLGTDTNISNILTTLDRQHPAVVVIDSIQTMWSEHVAGTPGSVAQVRAAAFELVRHAKQRGAAVFLVGHVTKEGQIAGPRVVEHMVDTVLYFEGDRGHQFRILRAVKNRYGPTNEVGVFEMTGKGLLGVENPSALFLSEREKPTPGSVVFAGIEGTRTLLVEIQALVAQSAFASPRRTVVGSDSGRMSMIIAVLESRCNLSFAGQDVYLNTGGGIRVTEPAADLAVAGALMSGLLNRSFPPSAVAFGEISLSGAIRSVAQTENRLREAAKLGFSKAMVPGGSKNLPVEGIDAKGLDDLPDLVNMFLDDKPQQSTG